MRTIRTLAALSAVALAATLGGCKSRANRATAAQPAPAPAPYYAQPYAPPPPAEAYVPAPPPPVSDPSVEEMQARALEAERRARELAEERARKAEDAMKSMASSPGGSSRGWEGAGGGETAAAAFAEDLRARCDAEIVQSGNTVLVRMSDAFKAGSDQLKPDVRQATTVHAVAEALMRNPQGSVAVVGHSDGSPIRKTKDKWSDNVHLSRARAETVARLLTEKGVGGPIAVDGRGDVEPLVYPERSSGDRARNRRVEVHVRF